MNKGTAALLILAMVLGTWVGCSSTIEEYDSDQRVLTRKFGPQDLKDLGGKLMDKLEKRNDDWMENRPTIALADIRNNTDRPGLNKQPFFDEIETSLFDMNKFDLIDHRESMKLLEEAAFGQSDQFDASQAVKLGKALRAHFIMWGDVSVLDDVGADGAAIKEYRLSLTITEVETQKMVYRATETAKVRAVR